MSWTYRVVSRAVEASGAECDTEYRIAEVHDGGGMTTEPVAPVSFALDGDDPVQSLRWQLECMLKSLDEPVLEEAVAI